MTRPAEKSLMPTGLNRPISPIFSVALVALAASPVRAQQSPPPHASTQVAQTVIESLGSVTVGVAWQATEFDITPETDCCTTSMSNGLEPTPLLYVQIPVRVLAGDAHNGIGYTVRAGYRRFELKKQDLGAAPTDQGDYGTRVSGTAVHLTPMFVAFTGSELMGVSAGLGLGLGYFSANGSILVRNQVTFALETQPVNVSTFASTFGFFAEYRLGPIVAAMEGALMQSTTGGTVYDLGISSLTLAWRIDL